ncbi:hypothetical protein IC744_16240 [Microbacterium hominis]|uniref:hypothetical protein n=1 Tax=Microbacterium TaxID=33882 RepID=UPI00168A7DC9|nr:MULTISPECIES: hypothetical protein [Microbacterium]QOC24810.1 hypothetical protein IC745_10485 [Microbacterium hominis]QOC28864.1 hypothetical protein IC744_16240 [Microbacterium hominis]QYF98934.1 hypothetical protein KY498_06890 [Microbacterium sp. PAMC21962]
MAVQVHYQGSVFDLDPTRSDAFWCSFIDETIATVNETGRPLPLGLNLADGRGAWLHLYPGTPIAVVAPAEILFHRHD